MAVRRLTNNPERNSNKWTPRIPRGAFRSRFPTLPRRGVRRLMKVDPQNAQGTPDSQLLVGEPGVTGKSGASKGVSVMGTQAQRIGAVGGTAGGAVKRIHNKGVNRSLKKR